MESLGRASTVVEGFQHWQVFVLEPFLWCLLTLYIWGKIIQCKMFTGPSSATAVSSRPFVLMLIGFAHPSKMNNSAMLFPCGAQSAVKLRAAQMCWEL